MNHFVVQRASQIRSVPFTGDSSDSDSDGGMGGVGNTSQNHDIDGRQSQGCVTDTLGRGTASSTSRATTSTTSGDISLTSPRQPGVPGLPGFPAKTLNRLSVQHQHRPNNPTLTPTPARHHNQNPELTSVNALPLMHKSKLGRLLDLSKTFPWPSFSQT